MVHEGARVHELLGSIPPVLNEFLGVILGGRLFNWSLTHHADCMKHHLDFLRWFVEDLNLVDVLRFYCVQGSLCLFEKRHRFCDLVFTLNPNGLGLHGNLVGFSLLCLDKLLLWLDHLCRFLGDLVHQHIGLLLHLLETWLFIIKVNLHVLNRLGRLHQLLDTCLVVGLLFKDLVALTLQ